MDARVWPAVTAGGGGRCEHVHTVRTPVRGVADLGGELVGEHVEHVGGLNVELAGAERHFLLWAPPPPPPPRSPHAPPTVSARRLREAGCPCARVRGDLPMDDAGD